MPTRRVTDLAKNVSHFAWHCVKQFYERHGFTRAASLAYTTLLAIAPLSIIVISLISFFPVFNDVLAEIEKFIFQNFVPHSGNIILTVLEEFQSRAHHLPWISFVFFFLTATLFLTTMESHLNELWGIQKRRFFGLSLIIHWLILTIGPLLLCLSLFLSSYLFSKIWLEQPLLKSINFILPVACAFLAYTFLYLTLPNYTVKLKNALAGALVATIFFEIAKISFIFYIHLVPAYSVVYGALAVIPLFLTWLYFASVIFLLGGQITYLLHTTVAERPYSAPAYT